MEEYETTKINLTVRDIVAKRRFIIQNRNTLTDEEFKEQYQLFPARVFKQYDFSKQHEIYGPILKTIEEKFNTGEFSLSEDVERWKKIKKQSDNREKVWTTGGKNN